MKKAANLIDLLLTYYFLVILAILRSFLYPSIPDISNKLYWFRSDCNVSR